ncbi:UMP-CMP kinase [Holothuria leucospilota]|uniref:UMP-CMP kinase n=1 Tax=Holothuria leucospilota TaxID=206669 RepID=A0A9Q1C7X1_HOLLE|nr:UMP-CMP kinase [Holothuria leucospilota]
MGVEKPLLIFVMGPSGSGRRTQCQKIAKHFGFGHLSVWDLLVEERKSGSNDGDLIENCIVEGKIVPSEITIGLIDKAMQKSTLQKFVLDGFPRNEDDLTGWNGLMKSKVNLKFILFFECPQEVCLNRILERGKTSSRSDDNRKSLEKRFEMYRVSSRPIIEHYVIQNLVRTIDGDAPPEEVKFRETLTVPERFYL